MNYIDVNYVNTQFQVDNLTNPINKNIDKYWF